MIEPKNGEWWLCERGGVKTVFLRKDDEWRSDEEDTYDYCNVTPLFKMIEDNPSGCVAGKPKRTRTEYEKVTESIFDLRDEFERGELYGDNTGVTKIETLAHLGACCQVGNVFRKVGKEIDWRDEVKSYLESTCSESLRLDGDSFTISHPELDFIYEPGDDEFLELCRVALRANGELD